MFWKVERLCYLGWLLRVVLLVRCCPGCGRRAAVYQRGAAPAWSHSETVTGVVYPAAHPPRRQACQAE